MIILGIETSCDETAAAVVGDDRSIYSNIILTQLKEHRPYGGVVPEIAARAHLDYLDDVIREALINSGKDLESLDGVAVTGGPGLIGGVTVGVMTAKAISAVHNLPFIAVNHLEGHALTARLTNDVKFPYLLLLVSGGHCQLLVVEDVGKYVRLGTTIDDAIGEAFDKTAKLLSLGYPGGPALEAAAKKGDPNRFKLPKPLFGRPGCDFSFSGLKTAVRNTVYKFPDGQLSPIDAADLAASFQTSVGDVITDRCNNALDSFLKTYTIDNPQLIVAGGVAANLYLRSCIEKLCDRRNIQMIAPPRKLCTDNAAMIAWAGLENLRRGINSNLDFAPRPRWPLDGL
ncbi:MAG: tRNA (adenosine(37)-N6)-threonylcarbamoyltransferase complex transferase subunit TsaD [Rhodospirillales bacterium]|nr:tRNA (adenosine(37)-N6)-threonylcarbamoyltransferase complex transferase subunit TsaD [Rhodospirillales bacterium]MBC94210.1 tRNA (adenosine(37)-N6)-threonylcarbamoyltransferase complex transferase subunit TsaD [Rhodospirillaceae bacterium]|tara:strand:+ start:577 stop:1605 length:1029 start_codon:yes stop_codon:yes gene_type:complete